MSAETATTRMYIHRRLVVRFLLVVLTILTALSFASIAFGWGQNSQTIVEDSATPTQLSDTSPFYVLLIGTDSLEGTALYSGSIDGQDADPLDQQADALTLVRVDPGTFTLTLVTVPANTVLYDGEDQLRDSLSEGGPLQAVYTVERITGIDVRYYFMFDFSDFETIIDQVGSLRANVPHSIEMQDPVTAKTVRVLQGADQELTGAQALAFLRTWDCYDTDPDAFRQRNVRDAEADVFWQILGFDDEKVRLVLGALEQHCVTDMDNSMLLALVTRFYQNKEAVQLFACTGPYLTTAIGPTGEPIIRQSTAAWRELMTVVDSGANPAEVLPQYDFQPIDPADYVIEKDAESESSSSSKASSSSKKKKSDAPKPKAKEQAPSQTEQPQPENAEQPQPEPEGGEGGEPEAPSEEG